MILHSIMISLSWYSAFFLMDDHSRELSVEHGDLSRDRKFKEVNRWLPLETLWRLKTGNLNCDWKDIPRKCEHLEIGHYIVRCLKVGWGSKCDSSHLWRRTLRSGVQKSRKLEISLNAYLHVAMDSTSILPTSMLPWIPHQCWSKPLHQGCAWGSSSIKRISTVGEGS